VGVEALGFAPSGAAVSWMTRPEELVVGEGVGFDESPPAVRVTTMDGVPRLEFDDPEGDAGVLLGWAAGVSAPVEDEVEDDEVEVAGGWPSVRNFERMLEASLGDTVVVVVVLAEFAVTVIVTVTAPGLSLLLLRPLVVDVEVDVEEVLDDVVVLVEPTLSAPVMPPLTPAAFIRPITVVSLVHSRDVPGARISGMAKHC